MLADALTAYTHELCLHLEEGMADIFDLVTPTTAELLHWWFGRSKVAARGRLNFLPRQRQAILNTIVAQEVLAAATLKDLYQQVVPQALLADERHAELDLGHAHPKYCLKMAREVDKIWVLQALVIWQLLNRSAAFEAGWTDARFTHNFLMAASGPIAYQGLVDMFLGRGHDRLRDFSSTAIVRAADLLTPVSQRERVLAFMRGNTRSHEAAGVFTGNGLIKICNAHALARLPEDAGTLDRLAALPELMVFNLEAPHASLDEKGTDEAAWHYSLSVLAARKGRRFVQIDFSATPTPFGSFGANEQMRRRPLSHLITTLP
jgi:type III restriction enzyme